MTEAFMHQPCRLTSPCKYAIVKSSIQRRDAHEKRKVSGIGGILSPACQLLVASLVVAAVTLSMPTAPVSLDTTHIACMVCLGIVNTGLGYYLYFSGVQRLSAQSVSICGYMEPFTALTLSAILLGESLTLLQWIGAACILGGVALSELWHPGKKG